MESPSVSLFLGDCRDVIPTLPEGMVNAVITDPPYGMGVRFGDMEDTEDEWLALVPPLVKWTDERSLPCIIFGGALTQARDLAAFHRAPDRTLIWAPAFTLSKTAANGILFRWHPIYCWNLPARCPGVQSDVLRESTDGRHWWDHPATKPLRLTERLVTIAAPEHVVLDPFMGSGTTGVACVRTGRRFVGVELDPVYFDIARRRIDEARSQLRLPLDLSQCERGEGGMVGLLAAQDCHSAYNSDEEGDHGETDQPEGEP